MGKTESVNVSVRVGGDDPSSEGWTDDPSLSESKKIRKQPPLDRFLRDWDRTEHPVEIKGIYIRHIADVDTVNQSYKIAVGFDMIWPASEQDVSNWKKDDANFVPQYVPNFEFPNAKEETMERRAMENGNPFRIDFVDGKHYNFLRTLVYLECIERMELEAFPFDVQTLTLILDMSFNPVEKAMFVPGRGCFKKPSDEGVVSDHENVSLVILNRQYCTLPDFDIRRITVQFASTCYEDDMAYDDEGVFRWGQVVMRFQLERAYEGYLYRIGVYNLLLSGCTACTFALGAADDLGDRIGFLITLILASVAFQFIVSQYLPNVSYLTMLDKYTLAVFTLTCTLLGAVSILGGLDVTDAVRATLDRYCFWTFIAVMIAVQVLFLYYGIRLRRQALKIFEMGELDLKKVNFNKDKDSMIKVDEKGLLPESKEAMDSDKVTAFVSFAGKEEE